VTQRNEAIERAMDAGITEPDAILKYLQENHPDLVRKGRREQIGLRSMMAAYQRRDRET
jgi:hypothetical protein